MNVTPFFSVIVCTFNRAHLLPRAINSLLVQSETDWELVIVDDGSTDHTATLIEQYRQTIPRCISIYHTNFGTGFSRTAGLQAASGRYITFLDSDDEYAPEHLQSRKTLLKKFPDTDLLHGGAEIIGNPYVADKNDPSRTIHLNDCVIGGTFVIRRECALQLGGFGAARYADDAEFFDKARAAGVCIRTTTIKTYRYDRTTEDSLCTLKLRCRG